MSEEVSADLRYRDLWQRARTRLLSRRPWIAFFAQSDQTIKRVPIGGGFAVPICPAKNPYGITWGPDGIVFGQGAEGIMRVSPDGGAPNGL